MLRTKQRNDRIKIRNAKLSYNASFISNSPTPCRAAWSLINCRRPRSIFGACCDVSADDFNTYFIQSANEILIKIPDLSLRDFDYVSNIPQVNVKFAWQPITPLYLVLFVNNFKLP